MKHHEENVRTCTGNAFHSYRALFFSCSESKTIEKKIIFSEAWSALKPFTTNGAAPRSKFLSFFFFFFKFSSSIVLLFFLFFPLRLPSAVRLPRQSERALACWSAPLTCYEKACKAPPLHSLIIGSASYIVREVLSVRERERERYRQTER